MKKVVIIGAGIAGLTCGIYARLAGFETQIYEMHNIPGGECTGWDRGDYHFDGCIHWLMGSKPGSDLYELWQTTGALNKDVRIVNHESFGTYEEDGKAVHLFTNADKLQEHLLDVSPQDGKEIRRLCKAIKAFGDFGMPMGKPMDMMSAGDGLKFAAKNITKLGMLSRYKKMSMKEFADGFKSPLLRNALLSAIPGDYTATSLVMTLASMHAGDSGYPIGGSRALAKRMEQRFLNLGGEVFYKHRADKIIIEDGKATGVRLSDGKEVRGDYIISCADGYATLHHMLEDKHTPKEFEELFENPKERFLATCSLVFLGLDCELPEEFRAITTKREQPIYISGVNADTHIMLSYDYDETMAPKGKSVVACLYDADYDFWNEAYQDKERYKQEKERLKQDAIAQLLQRYPQVEGKIEKTDVSTPMTYVRYCNAFRGAWMTGDSGPGVQTYHSGELPGLENFLMAGMWTLPPGGLPGAATAGRFAAHRLCIKEGIAFRVK